MYVGFTSKAIKLKCKEIVNLAHESKITDLDDLPVEAFIMASKKLFEQSESKLASSLYKTALNWIDGRKTYLKEKLENITGS